MNFSLTPVYSLVKVFKKSERGPFGPFFYSEIPLYVRKLLRLLHTPSHKGKSYRLAAIQKSFLPFQYQFSSTSRKTHFND